MNTKARKVMIIGAGNVGTSAAYALLNHLVAGSI